jgi:hypothetical protein
VLQDTSGIVQLVGPANLPVHVHREDALEIVGRVRKDERSPRGFEIDIIDIRVIGRSAESLPFFSGSELTDVGLETTLDIARCRYGPIVAARSFGWTLHWLKDSAQRYVVADSVRFSRRRLSLRVRRAARTCSLSGTLSASLTSRKARSSTMSMASMVSTCL